jgi:DNA-binding NarL/FixJ family response regulator
MSESKKKVLLVGHCGPDSSYLRSAVRSALKDVDILSADDNPSLQHAMASGVELALINRELGWGFDPQSGIEMISELRNRFPNIPLMLISNYPEAQSAAMAAGAVAGFGKSEIGKPRVGQVLKDVFSRTSDRQESPAQAVSK